MINLNKLEVHRNRINIFHLFNIIIWFEFFLLLLYNLRLIIIIGWRFILTITFLQLNKVIFINFILKLKSWLVRNSCLGWFGFNIWPCVQFSCPCLPLFFTSWLLQWLIVLWKRRQTWTVLSCKIEFSSRLFYLDVLIFIQVIPLIFILSDFICLSDFVLYFWLYLFGGIILRI